jgi:hypothetical protein
MPAAPAPAGKASLYKLSAPTKAGQALQQNIGPFRAFGKGFFVPVPHLGGTGTYPESYLHHAL